MSFYLSNIYFYLFTNLFIYLVTPKPSTVWTKLFINYILQANICYPWSWKVDKTKMLGKWKSLLDKFLNAFICNRQNLQYSIHVWKFQHQKEINTNYFWAFPYKVSFYSIRDTDRYRYFVNLLQFKVRQNCLSWVLHNSGWADFSHLRCLQ